MRGELCEGGKSGGMGHVGIRVSRPGHRQRKRISLRLDSHHVLPQLAAMRVPGIDVGEFFHRGWQRPDEVYPLRLLIGIDARILQ